MIVYLEVVVLWFVVTTLIYFLVAIYSRSVRRERLEKEFDAGGVYGERDAYVTEGLAAYEHGLKRRLIGLIYVLPAVAFVVVVYVVNYR